MEFTIEELLHIATVVEPGERVADGLHAQKFTQVKIGNRNRDLFGGGAGELDAASEDIGAVVWVGNGEHGIIVLDGERSEGLPIGDQGDANRRTLPEQVSATRGRSVLRDEYGRGRDEEPSIVAERISDQLDRCPIRRRSRRDFWTH